MLAAYKTIEFEDRLRCASKKTKSRPFRAKPLYFTTTHARSRRVTEESQTEPCRRKPTRQLAPKPVLWRESSGKNRSHTGLARTPGTAINPGRRGLEKGANFEPIFCDVSTPFSEPEA